MKRFIHLCLFTGMLVPAVVTANPAQIKVGGVIKAPACVPQLANNGAIDYGVIPAASLPKGGNLVLPDRQVAFSVTCEAPAMLAFGTVDNQGPTKVDGLGQLFTPPPYEYSMYGLGEVRGKKVGAFRLLFKDGTFTSGDGPLTTIQAGRSTGPDFWGWSASTPDHGFDNGLTAPHIVVSWARPGTLVPVAFRQITGMLEVGVALNKPENLDLSQDVPLQGSVTIDMFYM